MCGTKLVEAIESPNYTVATSESDFEIRLYSESTWLSAPVQATSFDQSTKNGFHRLLYYYFYYYYFSFCLVDEKNYDKMFCSY